MDSNLVVRALSALAHESRLAIFRLLVVAGPDGQAAGGIAQQLGLSPSSLSFHLKDLSHADLVESRQEGRFVIYTANFDAMTGLIGFLTENCCAGATCAASDLPNFCNDPACGNNASKK
ncbi:ArsR/SmtB family transcription factor [Paraburkholderia fungorum]|jgi:ArsR family transcriptional regulator, arsenate/arsenite/antimonite-responsive transcriptional repressor|uniref:ArsR/SmtB family transcription factor n=1 Tax=Paraburkholderia fungorum TaxID=134537 RepID=UPI000DB687C9|nr:metalloregulator ArsR/SmtB family transcription factor [Paraburkholderia fungorum]PZR38818.1 MAG: transcriptional regulator [Paraburkholderia fungorum]QLD52504.1 transcriptional regulator [Paraburkholderia fungorum]